MHAKQFFETMFYNIWQSHNIDLIDQYYAKAISETIQTVDEQHQLTVLEMGYDYMVEQSIIHKRDFKDTILDIKHITSSDNYISVNFYSSAVNKATGKKHARYVCGIWHLNAESKIERVWAVVTPNVIS